ncbi:hypothetical protein FRC12_012715 [Ceratobasidium sp. 428]|nr:hypothetical protein FRC12_012715 [Ceratobasidium sp. 428]
MQEALAILGTVRNRSKSLVPLNHLPFEIIVDILSLVAPKCIIDHQPHSDKVDHRLFPAVTMSTISKGLKYVVINAPSLWTHIDLLFGGPHEAVHVHHARSYLQYSGQSSLYVHAANFGTTEYQSERAIRVLAPHAQRIVSVSFHVVPRLAKELVLGLFDNTAAPYQTEMFCLNDRDCITIGEDIDRNFYRELFDGRLDKFLEPLQTVVLKGPVPPFQSVALRGLTVLKLSGCETTTSRPTLLQLIGVLAACPELRVLTLIYCQFDIKSKVPIEPVPLPKLELLDLRRAYAGELLGILSCITPGSNPLTLSMWGDPFMHEAGTIQLSNFINQSNVTRLYLESLYFPDDIPDPPQLLTHVFPGIQELALCDYSFNELAVLNPLDVKKFPSLRTLHVLRCDTDLSSWHALVDSSVIETVYTDDDYNSKLLARAIPFVRHRKYSGICRGEGDSEWPVCEYMSRF